MSNVLTNIASPVVQYVLYIALVVAIGAAVPFARRAYHWLLTKIPAAYRPLLSEWASEAVTYVEQFVTTGGGQAKFAAAVQRVIAITTHNKLSVSLQEIEGAIQKARNDAQAQGLLLPHKTPAIPATDATATTMPGAQPVQSSPAASPEAQSAQA